MLGTARGLVLQAAVRAGALQQGHRAWLAPLGCAVTLRELEVGGERCEATKSRRVLVLLDTEPPAYPGCVLSEAAAPAPSVVRFTALVVAERLEVGRVYFFKMFFKVVFKCFLCFLFFKDVFKCVFKYFYAFL